MNIELNNTVLAGESDFEEYIKNSEHLLDNSNITMLKNEEEDDKEKKIQYRLNSDGTIYYVIGTDKLSEKASKLFESVDVLFAAMSTAIGQEGKSLMDYEIWGRMIRASGYFVETQKMYRNLQIKSSSVSIDTQLIQQLIPGLKTGASLDIAKGVLSAFSGEFSTKDEKDETKLAHLLFICEDIVDSPKVLVRLFFASKKSHEIITASPCHKSTSVEINMIQEANSFRFVDPDSIAEFAKKFKELPQEYKNLIENLKKNIQ
ncbi:hypothetical protein [Acinetobacter guillouiae]|uniref:hypothetical protein n=1 Tax=Acinetobacter guillouiae TaxID=106649 RepID=UPI002FD9E605